MDEYLDHLFSSICGEPSQTNGMLSDSIGIYEGDKKNSPVGMTNSNLMIEGLVTQDTSSIVLGGDSDHGLGKGLLLEEAPRQQDLQNTEGNSSLNGAVNGRSEVGYVGLQLNTPTSTPCSLDLGSPKQLSLIGGMSRSSRPFTELDHVGCNGNEPSDFQRSVGNFQALPPIPQLWSQPSYGGGSSLSPVMGEYKMQGFGLQGEYVDNEMDIMRNRYVGDEILQLDNISSAIPIKGKEEQHTHPFSPPAVGPHMTMTASGLQSLPQTTVGTASGGCNGTGKPRVRARRGQATDPHSIAERLRREKIAERMKNLQELVPNSNKTDKASMLDEIIEYVKFLQLQVKVLSMSRLGAAEAVVPLITDGQAEGSKGLSLSPSAGQAEDICQSPDQIAFEQEVVKLMESNVTMAMQYLQSKGLCLMPIALATAISSGKAASSGTGSDEGKNGLIGGFIPNNNSSSSSSNTSSNSLPGIGTHHTSSDGNVVIGKLSREGITTSSCNGAINKQEELKSTSYTARELKAKT
ncbi:uncharacterized protein LOC117925019 isoform X2 [Vitis riparia]|uniref:uncharacterized protein LOC117925019 isoform X2 n=1 Tax=Vitis riparia TaxID=96939 RepID=UPI00155A2606|nr:uncharacterized protein LOC117925019 isoform X2 [Vitis riparia]